MYRFSTRYISRKAQSDNRFQTGHRAAVYLSAIYRGPLYEACLRKERKRNNVKTATCKARSTVVKGTGFKADASNFLTTATFLAATAIALTSCTGLRPLKGGKAVTARAPAGGIQQTLVQGDNPSQPTRQDQETIKLRTYTLPAGSRIEQSSTATSPALQHSNTPSVSVVLSAPMPVTEREETRAKTELGAAQKDNARELGAKLASLRGITWVGVALFIFGLATLAWPPLKAIIGSVTTSAAITLGGLALMILPTLIVGNELLILSGVALTTGAWFLAHRHGQLRGQLSAIDPVPLNLNPNPNLTLPQRAIAAPPQTGSVPGSAGVSPASSLPELETKN
jgi:hypothetical protein